MYALTFYMIMENILSDLSKSTGSSSFKSVLMSSYTLLAAFISSSAYKVNISNYISELIKVEMHIMEEKRCHH